MRFQQYTNIGIIPTPYWLYIGIIPIYVDMKTKHFAIILATIIVVSMGYTWLTPNSKQETITVSGAFALYPLMVKWSEDYMEVHPEVKFEISAGGAGKGMTDALNQLVDLGMVSREIYSEEITQGAVWVAVAKDAVVIDINSENPYLEYIMERGITEDDLEKIVVTEEITTWGELLGREEITDPINVYTRSDACGAAATIAQYIGYNQEDLLGIGVFGDPGLAEAVKNDVYGLGYNNVNYAYDLESGQAVEGLTVLPLDLNGDHVIDESEDFYGTRQQIILAITDGSYPSPPTRELNLVTLNGFSGASLEFLEWVLTEGQSSAMDAGYVPVSGEKAAAELSKIGK